jgi:hypothetical protein
MLRIWNMATILDHVIGPRQRGSGRGNLNLHDSDNSDIQIDKTQPNLKRQTDSGTQIDFQNWDGKRS